MPAWLVARGKNLVMAANNKCGSTSLRSHPAFVDTRSPEEALKFEVRVAWLRQPILRMHSAWRGFHVRSATENWRWGLDDESLATWENFVDHTFEHSNEHWNPQVPQLCTQDGKTFIPTIVEPFEALTERFNLYIDGPLTHENKSTSIVVDLNYRRDELEEKFRKDFELWESITT
jgi:hypothetical protein